MLADDFDLYFQLTSVLNLPIDQVGLGFCPTWESLGIPASGESVDQAGHWLYEPDATAYTTQLTSCFVPLHSLLPAQPPQLRIDPETFARCLPDMDGFGVVTSPGAGQSEQSLLQLAQDLYKLKKIDKGQLRKVIDHAELAESSPHPSAAAPPLLMYCRLKLGGLASLGCGLLLRKAVFRALARSIVRIQRRLLGILAAPSASASDERSMLEQLEIGESDVRSLRAAFLDMQGPEEIGVHLACSNYSVATLAVTEISSLTLGDICDPLIGGPAGERWSAATSVASTLSRYVSPGDPAPSQLMKNHVFSSTYSILGVDDEQHSMASRNALPVHGRVEGYARANVIAGHLHEVEEKIERGLASVPPALPPLRYGSVHRFLIGRYDYDFALAWRKDSPIESLHVSEFLDRSQSVRDHVVACNQRRKLPDGHADETGVLDLAIAIVVPYPKLSREPAVAEEHIAIVPALKRFADRLFQPDNGPLCTSRLNREARCIRLPLRLVRHVLHLYKNFYESLVDPLLYDSVIDLLDCFTALHHVIAQELPQAYDQFHSRRYMNWQDVEGSQRISSFFTSQFAHHKMIESISEYVEALENAHSHRICRESVMEVQDWAVDIRGGLIQLYHGAAVPLTCGAGLVKWCWRTGFAYPGKLVSADGHHDGDKEKEFPIGLVTELSLGQLKQIRRIRPHPSVFASLGIVDLSVGHIINPPEFVTHLHEAAHVIIDRWYQFELPAMLFRCELVGGDKFRDPDTGAPPPWKLEDTKTLWEELFADLLTQLLVFGSGNDAELGARFIVAKYGADPRSAANTHDKTTRQFIELMMRQYIVWKCVEHASENPQELSKAYPLAKYLTEADGQDIESLWPDFKKFLERHGPFWWPWKTVKTKSWWDDVSRLFSKYLPRRLYLAQDAWRRAVTIYQQFTEGRIPWFSTQDVSDAGQTSLRFEFSNLVEEFRRALVVGESSVWRILNRWHDGKLDFDKVDELGLVAAGLRAYIGLQLETFGEFPEETYVYRDQLGEVDYQTVDSPDGSWRPFQIDRGHAGCTAPIRGNGRLCIQCDIAFLRHALGYLYASKGTPLQSLAGQQDCPPRSSPGQAAWTRVNRWPDPLLGPAAFRRLGRIQARHGSRRLHRSTHRCEAAGERWPALIVSWSTCV